jgi:hypothetical protein
VKERERERERERAQILETRKETKEKGKKEK